MRISPCSGTACIIVHAVKDTLTGLGKRLLAYAIIVAAVVLVLRLVVGVVSGFIHTLILVAVLVFALYAISWALRFKRSA